MNQSKIDDELRKLALEYVELSKKGDVLGAEIVLHDLNKLRELTSVKNSEVFK
tara:strand:+ start:300 stop:458 length:159 start_codon:yes stop_codon:yes gene_type:complete